MSCLFQSLGRLIHRDPRLLRQQICDFLTSNPSLLPDGTRAAEIMKWESEKEAETYIREMRSTSVWGGAIEIKAFCECFRYNVHVLDVTQRPAQTIRFYCDNSIERTITIRWSGNHYEPVLP